MPPLQNQDLSKIKSVLVGLASKDLGVRDEGLYERLTPKLRQQWFIFDDDEIEPLLVLRKVTCHLDHHIGQLEISRDPLEKRNMIRVAFNVADIPQEARGLQYTNRLKWFYGESGSPASSVSNFQKIRDNLCGDLAKGIVSRPLNYEQLSIAMRKRFGVELSPYEEAVDSSHGEKEETPQSSPNSGTNEATDRPSWRPSIRLVATGTPAILVALAVAAVLGLNILPSGEEETAASDGQAEFSSDDSPSTSPPSASSSESEESIQNDCSVEGDNNNVECNVNKAPDYAEIAGVELFFDYAAFIFAGSAEDLPTPPSFPLSEQRGHCDDWHDWVIRQEDFYITYPTVVMHMQTGVAELLVVNDLEVNVMDVVDPPEEVVMVSCQQGAGLNVGYWVGYDTRTREGHFFNEMGEEVAIPPASFSLQPGEFESAGISFSSEQRKLYTGVLNISTRVDGRVLPVSLGNSDYPIRWYGLDRSLEELGSDAEMMAYSWDVTRGEWVDRSSVMGY